MRRRLISRPTRLCVTRLKHEEKIRQYFLSQRAASVRYADPDRCAGRRKAVAVGTHEELMQNCSAYQEFIIPISGGRAVLCLKTNSQ